MDENPQNPPPEESPRLPADAPLKGPARIEAYVKTLPDSPGVYRMLNAKGEVLYVGKASSLKKRVAAYTKPTAQTYRIAHMISETAEMIFISTASETEALLLESNLIKRLKPRYNVTYRDDKSFPTSCCAPDHPFPQVLKHRGARAQRRRLFRPLRLGRRGQHDAEHAAARLPAALLLRCGVPGPHASLPALPDKALQRAPAPGRIDAESYAALVAQAKTFLTGKSRSVQEQLAREDERRLRAHGFRERGAIARPHPRDEPNPRAPGDQSIHLREADVFALHARVRNLACRCSSSAPTKIGATARFSRAMRGTSATTRCSHRF
jgi:excinuclease ABC subunit C